MQATHRLAQQRPSPHFAVVTVAVESQTQRQAVVSPNAFSWLQDEYGDRASLGLAHDDYRHEASTGAMYALQLAGVGGHVTVTEIKYNVADTAPGDVKYASAWAVWQALSVEPSSPPWIDAQGAHFPSEGEPL